jgi:hypothetical protein
MFMELAVPNFKLTFQLQAEVRQLCSRLHMDESVQYQLDVCPQPTRTHNSITVDTEVFIYPNMFRRITASSSGGACSKNTKTPLKTFKSLKNIQHSFSVVHNALFSYQTH